MFTVYRALNLKTGKSYIGQTRRELHQRIYSHTSQKANTVFGLALKESEESDWEWSVLEKVETINEAHERECFYIAHFKAMTNGYNGIVGKYKYTLDSRLRMSTSAQKRKPWNAGRKGVYSPETIEKMALAKMGAKATRSPEQIRARVIATKMACSKAVKNKITNEIYPSVTDAAKSLGVTKSTITRILSGKINPRTIRIEYFTKE